jgi:hypothetical protein
MELRCISIPVHTQRFSLMVLNLNGRKKIFFFFFYLFSLIFFLLLLFSCRAISGSNGGAIYLGENVLYINFENTNFTNNTASRTGIDIYALNPDAFQTAEGQISIKKVYTDQNNTVSIAGNISKVKIPLYPGMEEV